MKIKSFRIKNYKSIQDTGDVRFNKDRITIFAGQNESGKSAILEALYAFEQGEFDEDSIPIVSDESVQGITITNQEVICTYQIESSDGNFWEEFENQLAKDLELSYMQPGDIFNLNKLTNKIDEFKLKCSIDRTTTKPEAERSIENELLQIIHANVIEKEVEIDKENLDDSANAKVEKQKKVNLSDKNSAVAETLWRMAPKLLLFNDFCDLLPDKISIADLKVKNTNAKGYNAVKNFEKLSKTNFQKLYSMDDLKRGSIEETNNEIISVDFTNAWKQKIYADNNVKIAYQFEKRDTEDNSYIIFYVETKDKQKLRPRLRSKGLIWFLSFWMELKASGDDKNIIILADEPGLYLHIRAQEDILNVFDDLARQGNQILYTTHSPNLIPTNRLERINLVLNHKKKGTIIEGVTTSKIDSKNKQDALQPVANAIGFAVSDFALSNKKTVLLEGVSDYYYYSGMRILLNRNDNYSLVPGIGVRKQYTLVSFCVGYGIDWVSVFDDDSSKGQDSQNTYENIKEYLFGDDEKLADTKTHITKDISCVENMFTIEDLRLVDSGLKAKQDSALSVGKRRKVVFAKTFFEKIQYHAIKKSELSNAAVTNFTKVFDWIEKNLNL